MLKQYFHHENKTDKTLGDKPSNICSKCDWRWCSCPYSWS